METIIDYLQRKLKEAGPSRWEDIAEHCGVAATLPRKIAYGDRTNPTLSNVQPLWDYFQLQDRGAAAKKK